VFTLDKIVPWGRSFDEYRRMFALSDADLQKKILGCGDGPASFNAEGTRRGVAIVSCDPLYRFNTDAISTRIDETYGLIIDQTRKNQHEYVWTTIRSVEELGAARMRAMRVFLDDFNEGLSSGRYIDAELPSLPFANHSFDIAVCSHFLFLYAEQLTRGFHLAALDELCRVAGELRVFPLQTFGAVPSPHVEPAVEHLTSRGFNVSIETVDYEFQRGGNQMMRVTRTQA
jgi:hypothetical protein